MNGQKAYKPLRAAVECKEFVAIQVRFTKTKILDLKNLKYFRNYK
jgi:hypothetical protein